MKSLTWKEFKDHIDKQLAELGISEDTEIWYIDISFPYSRYFNITIDDACGIAIS